MTAGSLPHLILVLAQGGEGQLREGQCARAFALLGENTIHRTFRHRSAIQALQANGIGIRLKGGRPCGFNAQADHSLAGIIRDGCGDQQQHHQRGRKRRNSLEMIRHNGSLLERG